MLIKFWQATFIFHNRRSRRWIGSEKVSRTRYNEKRLHCCDCYAFGLLLSSQFVNTDGAHNRHRHIISTNICEASCRLLTKSSNLCGKIRSKTISEKFSLVRKKPKRFLHIQTRWFIDGFTWEFEIFIGIEQCTSKLQGSLGNTMQEKNCFSYLWWVCLTGK